MLFSTWGGQAAVHFIFRVEEALFPYITKRNSAANHVEESERNVQKKFVSFVLFKKSFVNFVLLKKSFFLYISSTFSLLFFLVRIFKFFVCHITQEHGQKNVRKIFESRLRAHATRGGGGNQGNQHNLRHHRNAQSSYASRVNPHVIAANKVELAAGAKQRQEAQLEELRSKKRKLDHDIATKAWHATVDFIGVHLAEKEALRQRDKLEQQIAQLESEDAEALFYARFGPLKPDLGTLAVLAHATGESEEIFSVNPHICSVCSRIYLFDASYFHMQVLHKSVDSQRRREFQRHDA